MSLVYNYINPLLDLTGGIGSTGSTGYTGEQGPTGYTGAFSFEYKSETTGFIDVDSVIGNGFSRTVTFNTEFTSTPNVVFNVNYDNNANFYTKTRNITTTGFDFTTNDVINNAESVFVDVNSVKIGSKFGQSAALINRQTVGSVTISSGIPFVIYRDVNGNGIFYSYATGIGENWSSYSGTNVSGDDPNLLSLVNIDNRPALFYANSVNPEVRYIIASDSTGTTWSTPIGSVDLEGLVIEYQKGIKLNLSNIPYSVFSTEDNIYYSKGDAADATSFSTGTIVSIDADNLYFGVSPRSGFDGEVVVMYRNIGTNEIEILTSSAGGTNWGGTPQTVDGDFTSNAGYMELQITSSSYHALVVQNSPAVLYYYHRESLGSTWNKVVVDSITVTNNTDSYKPSLVVFNDIPYISLDRTFTFIPSGFGASAISQQVIEFFSPDSEVGQDIASFRRLNIQTSPLSTAYNSTNSAYLAYDENDTPKTVFTTTEIGLPKHFYPIIASGNVSWVANTASNS